MNSTLLTRIQQESKQLYNQLIQWRRHIHQHPELSFQEYKTSEFVHAILTEIGIQSIVKKANTGLVALIEGKNPTKKVIALRADMDALPIIEQNQVEYKSIHEGIMHACGHDVHTASLLGVASILYQLRNEWEGTVKFIFQPGEEKLPGGASIMIDEGALKNPAPTAIFGQHVMPLLEQGKIGLRSGLYMASTDEIYVTIKGKGGHGAMPHLGVDPVLMASHMVVALQQIVSRNANPTIPTVLSFGKFIANGATNVIPNEVHLEGTFRTLDENWRKIAHHRMQELAENLVDSMGGQCVFEIRKGYPFLKNNPELTQHARIYAEQYVGKENVVDLDIWMAAEDFAYYSQEMPACLYRLGTRNESLGITSGVHTPTFNIDERALELGAGLMAWMAVNELARN